jgi:uncharacterized membrane protein YfcA
MLAFVIRGLTGFGSGLLMVPLMILFLDMKLVVSVAAVFAIPSGIMLILTFKTWHWLRKDILPVLIGGAIVGTIIGAYILASYKSDILKKIFGLFLVGYALKTLFWKRTSLKKPNRYIGILAGFLGGGLGGLFSTGGPPVVIYLNSIINDKRIFRATILFYLLVINSWQFVTYIYYGLITVDVLKFSLYLFPAFIIGNLTGALIHIKINDLLFNRIVAIILLVTGITILL